MSIELKEYNWYDNNFSFYIRTWHYKSYEINLQLTTDMNLPNCSYSEVWRMYHTSAAGRQLLTWGLGSPPMWNFRWTQWHTLSQVLSFLPQSWSHWYPIFIYHSSWDNSLLNTWLTPLLGQINRDGTLGYTDAWDYRYSCSFRWWTGISIRTWVWFFSNGHIHQWGIQLALLTHKLW